MTTDLEIGGPLRRNKAWIWGAFARQDVRVGVLGFLKPGATDANDPDSLETDRTEITHYNGKLEWQWVPSNKTTFLVTRAVSKRNAVNASPTRPPETTQLQSNPTTLYKFAQQWMPSSRWLLEAQFARVAQESPSISAHQN